MACAFQQSCPCLCDSFCSNSPGAGNTATKASASPRGSLSQKWKSWASCATSAPFQCGWKLFSSNHSKICWERGFEQSQHLGFGRLVLMATLSLVWWEPLWTESPPLRSLVLQTICFGHRGIRDLGVWSSWNVVSQHKAAA